MFTKGSHNRNLSVILITKNVYHQARHCREIDKREIFGRPKKRW
jgi:hypothetical protein